MILTMLWESFWIVLIVLFTYLYVWFGINFTEDCDDMLEKLHFYAFKEIRDTNSVQEICFWSSRKASY